MPNNYDHIAKVYDFLSRLVFFKAQVNVQVTQLTYLCPGTSVLIVGGGTGWILEEITKLQPSGLRITYMEISKNMLARAQQRKYGLNEVKFIHQAIEDATLIGDYDVVITAFLFDNFKEEKASNVFMMLHEHLKAGGKWFFADFFLPPEQASYWKRWLLGTMYTFFQWLCQVEASHLPPMESFFQQQGYSVIHRSWHYFKFIQGIVYQK